MTRTSSSLHDRALLEQSRLGESLELYAHLVAIKPRERYVFRSDYYEIDGMSDGVYVDVLAVQQAPREASTR